MGKPRKQRSQPKPSPLQQVHFTRPLSLAPASSPPEMGLVRDPQFWKRFSVAAHQAEVKEVSPTSSTSDGESGYGDQWLTQQHKEKRRCRVLCASITVVIAVTITAGAVVAWWFTKGRN
ncbi:hypothetical protein PVAG01_04145 [Phlyctema vagabunda]|uniref:Uncharacterized protein n=1 Tax=Phlyctema vagabunda TaxID=108571 RepID=A0ABR4PNG4_9HELO